MERWKGKVAVVTGASCGIGACIAEELVKAGLLVVGFARRPHLIKENAKNLLKYPGKLFACQVDISKENEVCDAFQWTLQNLGPVYILINNAGLMLNTSVLDGEKDLWASVLQTNVIGLAIATREAYKIMSDNKINGHIVNVNSILGHRIINFPGGGLYGASKFAVTNYHECLRQELNARGSQIKVSSISPGKVDTEFFDKADENMKESVKMDGILNAKDVADGIMYILSTPPNVQIHELVIQAVGEKI